jgi:Flp pilus assembly protein TadG
MAMKNVMGWLKLQAQAFALAKDGAVAPLVGIGAIMMVGAIGVAIDTARLQLVQTRLSNSLDAAGLAAGATVSTTNASSEATKYLNSNFNGYMSATLTNTTVTVNSDNTVISLSASANVPTMFMKIFGITSNTVSATSEITRASKGLELVMVLDNTGSMAGSKLSSLKTAANNLVTILHGNSTPNNLWIGLVPFAQAVNVGSTRTSWLDQTHYNSLNWGPTSWMGCLDARNNNRDTTDDPPSVQAFKAYYWPDTNKNTHNNSNNWIKSNGNYNSPLDISLGPNKSCSQAVTPMTSSKDTITNAVNAMVAVGNTHISEGAAWGWRMLSPRWQGLWGGDMNANSLPLAYHTQNMNKAVIIMTDGDNTIDDDNRGAYGYLSDGTLGTTNQSSAETKLDQRLTADCTAMKNNNIYVYTVSFGSITSSSKTMLQNCATQSDFYFDSPDSATLQAAFQAIGDSLSNLRISR